MAWWQNDRCQLLKSLCMLSCLWLFSHCYCCVTSHPNLVVQNIQFIIFICFVGQESTQRVVRMAHLCPRISESLPRKTWRCRMTWPLDAKICWRRIHSHVWWRILWGTVGVYSGLVVELLHVTSPYRLSHGLSALKVSWQESENVFPERIETFSYNLALEDTRINSVVICCLRQRQRPTQVKRKGVYIPTVDGNSVKVTHKGRLVRQINCYSLLQKMLSASCPFCAEWSFSRGSSLVYRDLSASHRRYICIPLTMSYCHWSVISIFRSPANNQISHLLPPIRLYVLFPQPQVFLDKT